MMVGASNARYFSRVTQLGENTAKQSKSKFYSTRPLSLTTGPKAAGCQTTRPTLLSRIADSRRGHPLLWNSNQIPVRRRFFASETGKEDLKRITLYDLHVAKKAKFVPFAGYSMPLYYDDLSHVESHHWTREKASIFDVSHMYGRQGPLRSTLSLILTSALGFSISYPVPRPRPF
jgi:hypothetical protein